MAEIKLEGSKWSVKTVDKSRGRMKLNIKLSKDEAQGFKNWASLVKPPEIAEEEFLKQIFFNGIEHLNEKLQKISEQIIKEQADAAAANPPAPETTVVEPKQ